MPGAFFDKISKINWKGQCHEIYGIRFFHNHFPSGSLSYALSTISTFFFSRNFAKIFATHGAPLVQCPWHWWSMAEMSETKSFIHILFWHYWVTVKHLEIDFLTIFVAIIHCCQLCNYANYRRRRWHRWKITNILWHSHFYLCLDVVPTNTIVMLLSYINLFVWKSFLRNLKRKSLYPFLTVESTTYRKKQMYREKKI